MQTITWLSQLQSSDVALVGGKAANLGELTKAGLPVPPGFVITTTAFTDFLRANNLHQPTAEQIIAAPLMPAFAAATIDAFTKLNAPFVAVRSSATAEDGVSHAWAGQLESYVPTSAAALLDNIKKCWASLYSPRALAYRQQSKAGDVSVAVVVQSLVDADVAGIAFSAHPVTGDDNHMVIEAVFGLGEAAVGGHVTPDTYVLHKQTGKVVEHYPAVQTTYLTRQADGTAAWLPLTTKQPKLSNRQIQQLAHYITTIESHYGFACDIEWTLAGNTFYIVQSRPITTL